MSKRKPKDGVGRPLKIRPVPVPQGLGHPKAPHPVLPPHEHTMGIIAPGNYLFFKFTLIIILITF